MANEFRVKNGLIVDETSSGAGVLTIADGDIANDDGSIAITVVDGQSVTIGKEGDHANIIVTPHGTAGSELITLLNTSGTDAAAIKLNAVAGGIDVDAVKGLTLTNASAAGGDDITIQQTGGNDSSIHILAAGTGTDAINISATAGDMLIGTALLNAKTLKIGPASATQMIFAPHGTAGSEKITLTNTSGTGSDAIKIESTAGGMTLTTTTNGVTINGGGLYLKEQSAAAADRTSFGQLWVDDAEPNELYFTNDAGTDIQLTSGNTTPSGPITALNDATANELVTVGSTTTELDAQSLLTFASATLNVGAAGNGADLLLHSATAAHVGLKWDHDADTNGTLTGGADDHGVDFKFFGETAGKYIQWDMSGDELVLASSAKISFHDAAGGENIVASADGHLEINAGTTLDMTSATIDINGTTEVQVDTATFDVNGTTAVTIDCSNTTNGVTIGTATSGVPITIGHGTSEVTVGDNLTVSGDLIVSGTTTTVHVETTTTSSGVIFEGTTGDGHDGTLKSVVAGADVTYTLPNVTGHVALFAADPSTTTISATPAELNLLDTAVANTVVNSKAVIYGSSGEIAGTLSTAAQANITSVGTLGSLTIDDVAIDGKVITMTGSSSDTVTMTAATNGEFTLATVDAGGAAAHMNLDADGKIVLNTADDEHVVFEQAGVDFLAIGQGTVAIANIEDSAGATVVDTWDASVYTAVKYLLVVENVTNSNQRMAVEMFVMGDDEPTNSAAYSTTYAVLFDAEIGVFSAAGRSSSDLIDLKYTPTATGGTVNHKVRVVAQRIASI
jgi:hypothetical protein